MIHGVLRKSYNFYMSYDKEDYPLRYDERRMITLFASSIDDITPCHMAEYPAKRGKVLTLNQDEGSKVNQHSPARIDLWCYFRDKDILIELKRSYCTSHLPTSTRLEGAWSRLVAQIDGLEGDAKEWSYSFLRVGVLTVWVYEGKRSTTKGKEPAILLHEIERRFAESITPSAWSSMWVPPGGAIEFSFTDDQGKSVTEKCKAVLFFAYLPETPDGYA